MMLTTPERLRDLALRIERFHGVTLNRVLEEIAYLRDVDDVVIAGGSLADGLGNGLSDLDLVISGPATVESSRVPLEHFVGSLRVDVWKLAQELIEGFFERAEKALASEEQLLGDFGDIDDEDGFKLLHRIAFGVIVDGNELELERGGMDCREVASGLVVRDYAERMRASALVAQLALRTSRPVAAVVNARLAVENALNIAVTQRGFPFSGAKWLGERLNTEVPELVGLHEPFRRLPADPAGDGPGFVEAALHVCAEMWGIELDFDALATLARWHSTEDVQLGEVGADQLLLAPRSGVIWELSEKEANVWRRLTAAEGGEQGEGWGFLDCGLEGMTFCMGLYELGLLDLSWIEGVPIRLFDIEREVGV
jgi:nucleotidyltransferase-like protein